VKLGGSLVAEGDLTPLLQALVDAAKTQPLVLVPGGGPFADAVRAVSDRHAAGESTAHWMAILAMDQLAMLLAGLAPAARLAGEPREIAAVCAQGRLAIVAPFAWLRSEDPLPHGWHVTSDSLAAWIAGALGAARLLLLKSRAGVTDAAGKTLERAEPRAAARAALVDDFFPSALPPGIVCWIVDGRVPEAVADAVSGRELKGTRLA
jgi:5-(aminomethyl)-3-furanmethanol phosphate kinase